MKTFKQYLKEAFDKPDEGGRNRLYTKLTKLNDGYSEYLTAYSNKHFIPVNRGK